MAELFEWLASNHYLLLFVVVLGAILLGKATVKGHGLGTVASAVVVGAAISAFAAVAGVKIVIDDATRSIFFCLFVFGLGLRIGPSLVHCGRGDGLKFTALAFVCSLLGLLGAVLLAKALELPAGAAGGILAGAMTMPASIGAAEEAVRQGVLGLPPGKAVEDAKGMIALCYAFTCLWGAVGIVLTCKYLPAWWGIDARGEAKKHEEALGVPHIDDAGLTGYRPTSVRAYRLRNEALTGCSVKQFLEKHPQVKVLNVLRGEPTRRSAIARAAPMFSMAEAPVALAASGAQGTTLLRDPDTTPPGRARADRGVLPETTYAKLGAPDDLRLRQGDIVTIGGSAEAMSANAALVGPEVPDPAALNVPLDAAEILVTNSAVMGRELAELRTRDFAGQVAIHHIERGGVPIPLGLHLKLQRFDVLFVAGVKSGVENLAALAGRIARPAASTDLLVLSAGMILGLLVGQVHVPVGATKIGLGNAGGLLLAGLVVSTFVSRVRFFGYTPGAARNLLEDLGLLVFVSIVGVNAGAVLATQLSGPLAARILAAGFVVGTLPPVVAWAVGHHWMKINPAILMGSIAGARASSAPAREAARETGSSVPWIGFPVSYAVSAVLLTLFGYLAVVLAT
jgi:putative transport protein